MLGIPENIGYRAARSTIPSLYFKDENMLVIKGILTDTIENISSERPFRNIDFLRQGCLWTFAREFLNWLREIDTMIETH